MKSAEQIDAYASAGKQRRRFVGISRLSTFLLVMAVFFQIFVILRPEAHSADEMRLARIGDIQIFAHGGLIQIHHGRVMAPVVLVQPVEVHEKPMDVGVFVCRVIPNATGKSVVWTVTLPIILFVLLFAMMPGWQLVRRIWPAQDAMNHCRNCEYDLRASTDRCPECGTPINRLE